MEGGPPCFPQGFTCPGVLRLGGPEVLSLSHTGLSPSMARLSRTLLLERGFFTSWSLRSGSHHRPATPTVQRLRPFAHRGFGLFPVRSPLLGESPPPLLAAAPGLLSRVLISLPRPTKMFQFGRCPPLAYGFSQRCLGIPPGGFPHSGIPGSQPAGGSPGLIAASHALHRPLAPRHPPCALSSLTLGRYPAPTLFHPVQLLRC